MSTKMDKAMNCIYLKMTKRNRTEKKKKPSWNTNSLSTTHKNVQHQTPNSHDLYRVTYLCGVKINR